MLGILNIFPGLLTYTLIAPLIIRLTLAFIFINFGYRGLKNERASWIRIFEIIGLKPAKAFERLFSWIEIIGGLMLLIGAYTQAAALVFSIVSAAEVFLEYREPSLLKNNIFFYVLLLAASLSLLFTGAGFFALDLPL